MSPITHTKAKLKTKHTIKHRHEYNDSSTQITSTSILCTSSTTFTATTKLIQLRKRTSISHATTQTTPSPEQIVRAFTSGSVCKEDIIGYRIALVRSKMKRRNIRHIIHKFKKTIAKSDLPSNEKQLIFAEIIRSGTETQHITRYELNQPALKDTPDQETIIKLLTTAQIKPKQALPFRLALLKQGVSTENLKTITRHTKEAILKSDLTPSCKTKLLKAFTASCKYTNSIKRNTIRKQQITKHSDFKASDKSVEDIRKALVTGNVKPHEVIPFRLALIPKLTRGSIKSLMYRFKQAIIRSHNPDKEQFLNAIQQSGRIANSLSEVPCVIPPHVSKLIKAMENGSLPLNKLKEAKTTISRLTSTNKYRYHEKNLKLLLLSKATNTQKKQLILQAFEDIKHIRKPKTKRNSYTDTNALQNEETGQKHKTTKQPEYSPPSYINFPIPETEYDPFESHSSQLPPLNIIPESFEEGFIDDNYADTSETTKIDLEIYNSMHYNY